MCKIILLNSLVCIALLPKVQALRSSRAHHHRRRPGHRGHHHSSWYIIYEAPIKSNACVQYVIPLVSFVLFGGTLSFYLVWLHHLQAFSILHCGIRPLKSPMFGTMKKCEKHFVNCAFNLQSFDKIRPGWDTFLTHSSSWSYHFSGH